MDILHIVSAGAAQAVVSELAAALLEEGTHRVDARFGAVQTMKKSVLAGEPADVVILTDRLIDELIGAGLVVSGSRVDLGSVATGIAVRAGTAMPDIADLPALRATLLAAHRIHCPDPDAATAGKVLRDLLQRLGIAEAVQDRLQRCPSGTAAMASLLQGSGPGEIGVMQVTEIVAHQPAAVLVGTLPKELAASALYAAGLAASSRQPAPSTEFIRRLAAGQSRLRAAGFGA